MTYAAVQAFIHGPLSQASKAEARRLQETVAEYLAPMLDIITAMPAIQVQTDARPHLDCPYSAELMHAPTRVSTALR